MPVKILTLFCILVALIVISALILRGRIRHYHPLTWGSIELFWYLISFMAVCIGLIEIERIEKVNAYREQEKRLIEDYNSKKNLLAAQTWILKLDKKTSKEESDGLLWFHKMKSLFDEGLETTRWEKFVNYTRSYVFKDRGCYADVTTNQQEFAWPAYKKTDPERIFLKNEMRWVVDSLTSLTERKHALSAMRPEDNTNYKIRYVLVMLYLIGLSLKIVKIYADYRKAAGK
jgi:hypothetical protein